MAFRSNSKPDPVKITSPLTSFNEVEVASLSPSGQADFVYGITSEAFQTASFSGGSVTGSNQFAIVSSGTSITGSGDVSLRRNLKYRPGQGSLARLTALFDTPAQGNVQLAGVGNSESGYFFGYSGTQFGIIHQEISDREIRVLTVSAGAGTETVTVTLNNVSVAVPVTGGADINTTSYQISKYNYANVGAGWFTDVIDGKVYFIGSRPGARSGTYSATGTATFAGTFAGLVSGSAGTSSFIPQESWNIDPLCGGCNSEFVLDPQKGNVYQIGYQYLGFGNAFFGVESPETGRIVPVHIIKLANNRTTPVLKNPQMATRIVSANVGGTTNVSVKCASMAAFTQGNVRNLDPRFARSFSFTNYNNSTYRGLVIFRVNRIFRGISCFGEMDILRLSASNESTAKTLSVALFRNPTILNGTAVNFLQNDVNTSFVSYSNLSLSADNFTATVPASISFQVGANNATSLDILTNDLVFGQGDTILIAIKTSGQVTGELSINWYEQQ